MQIAFVVDDMTMLRYYVPLSRRIHAFDASIKQSFFLRLDNHKYNGLSNLANRDRCMEILDVYCGYGNIVYDDAVEYDIVFQVESGSKLKCKKRVAIQHGFDYVGHLNDLKSNVDVYICSSKETANEPSDAGLNCVVPPLPVSVWDLQNIVSVSDKPAVLVYYPDQGENELATQLVDCLEAANVRVIVKQRKKHQAIMSAGIHVYDEMWYPSEAIVLASTSHLTIGFGSSAYTDLVPLGIKYVNIDIRSNERPWNAFKHPDSERYIRLVDRSTVIQEIMSLDFKNSKRPINTVTDADLSSFISTLLEV